MMDGLIEGRIVHYVLPDKQCRPAIVVWVRRDSSDACEGYVNLQVFTDGINDRPYGEKYATCPYWATSICYSENKEPDTWHWIEKA